MDYTKVNQIRAKKVNNSTYKAHIMEVEELPRPVEASPPKKDNDHNPFVEKKERRDYSAEIKARNEEMAQYMREVKENNQMMYEDVSPPVIFFFKYASQLLYDGSEYLRKCFVQ